MYPLVGMFVFWDDQEYHRTGKIVEAINDQTFLVQFDCMAGSEDFKWPLEVVSLEEMITSITEADDGVIKKHWGLFKTEEDLKRYLEWINTPAKPAAIVSIRKTRE